MKLKNKLAIEGAENCGEYSHSCTKWYLKGFEKAREMALDKCNQAQVEPQDDYFQERHELADKQFNLGCMECQLSIASLGEEEVN